MTTALSLAWKRGKSMKLRLICFFVNAFDGTTRGVVHVLE
jgi:hypothetical protein